MSAGGPEPALLDRIPLGSLLAAALRALLPAEEREEFLGDLVEEAHLRLRRSPRSEVALWMWGQALRSAPSLVSWRLRRLVGRRLAPAGVLIASRVGPRGWTVSLVVSVSAHALVLLAVTGWVFSRVEEIQPARLLGIDLTALLEPTLMEPAEPAEPAGPPAPPVAQARIRRFKPSRRPVPAPPAVAPAAEPALPSPGPGATAPPAPAGGSPVLASAGLSGVAGGQSTEPRLRLPPRVGEKRCLSCPSPQLPHPYARLGIGQEMVVRACVNVRGQVSSVKVENGVDPVVDAKVVETVRSWRLAPYSLNGHPVPFCYTTRFLFTTH